MPRKTSVIIKDETYDPNPSMIYEGLVRNTVLGGTIPSRQGWSTNVVVVPDIKLRNLAVRDAERRKVVPGGCKSPLM